MVKGITNTRILLAIYLKMITTLTIVSRFIIYVSKVKTMNQSELRLGNLVTQKGSNLALIGKELIKNEL